MSPQLIQSTLEDCLNIPEVMADAQYCEFQYILEVVDANGVAQQFHILPLRAQLEYVI